MAWIKSIPELEDHPKLLHLTMLTGWDRFQAIGAVHHLWYWTVRYAEDGDLSRFDPIVYFSNMPVKGDPKDILEAFITAGFVDKNLFVHDWWERTKEYMHKKYHTSNPNKLKEMRRKNKDILKDALRGSSRTHRQSKAKQDLLSFNKDKSFKSNKPENLQEVLAVFVEMGSTQEEARKFWFHYEANGWKVGKNSMKKWRAAVAGWISRNPRPSPPKSAQTRQFRDCFVCGGGTRVPEADWGAHWQVHEEERRNRPAAPEVIKTDVVVKSEE